MNHRYLQSFKTRWFLLTEQRQVKFNMQNSPLRRVVATNKNSSTTGDTGSHIPSSSDVPLHSHLTHIHKFIYTAACTQAVQNLSCGKSPLCASFWNSVKLRSRDSRSPSFHKMMRWSAEHVASPSSPKYRNICKETITITMMLTWDCQTA